MPSTERSCLLSNLAGFQWHVEVSAPHQVSVLRPLEESIFGKLPMRWNIQPEHIPIVSSE